MAASPHPVAVLVTLLGTLSASGTVEECPPWFTLDTSNNSLSPQCVCIDMLEYKITCDQRKLSSSVRLGFCAFQDSATNGTVVADCPYVFPDHLIVAEHIPLPRKPSELNQFMCGSLNRDTGTTLCGRCTNGTGPSIYSVGSQCVGCSAVNIVYYLLLRYLPTTIFFVVIIVLRISVTSAPMALYVLFCNSLVFYFKITNVSIKFVCPASIISLAIKILFVLNATWSFDPFYFVSPPLCVSAHMEEIYIPFLDTIATLYPFILLLLTYAGIELHARDFKPIVCLWRPLHKIYTKLRRTWDPYPSVIQTFATLFFLSYTKLTLLIYEALLISLVISEEGEVVMIVTSIDPTVPFFSKKHCYLISLSVFISVFLIIPPLLLLIIFPTRVFRKVSEYMKPRWNVSIRTFVDTFHGCYKDGTDGTRDYRAVSGYLLVAFTLIPAVLIVTRAQTTETMFQVVVSLIYFISLTAAFAFLQPYKHSVANYSAVTLCTIYALAIALFSSFYSNSDSNIAVVVLIAVLLNLPHCVFYGYLVYRLGKRLTRCCCKTQEVDNNVGELPCGPATTTGYSEFVEVTSQE